MWRLIRISILITVLAFVALGAYVDRWRTTDWDHPLWIGVFPVNADGRAATARYIDTLERADFAGIEAFFAREARAFDVPIDEPVRIELYPRIEEPPPRLEPGTGVPGRILWSLRARFYSWRMGGDELADIRVFVLYHDPEHTFAVPHSLGLQKGLLGIVHAYADAVHAPSNEVVIAHEVMHTLGATDKYDPVTNLPLYPHGYGDPEADPTYPQDWAEVMAGRIALSPQEAEMPRSLAQVLVGPETAAEVNWIRR